MKRQRSAPRGSRPRRRYSVESLEQRLALDGNGVAEPAASPPAIDDPMQLHVDPYPCLSATRSDVIEFCGPLDAAPGNDIHANRPGNAATLLETADDGFDRVQSHLDSQYDVDAFRVIAKGDALHISALLFFVPETSVLRVIDGGTRETVAQFDAQDQTDAAGDHDGFIDCDCGDYGFIDLFPGLEVPVDAGNTYYVTIEAGGNDSGRYILDVFDVEAIDTPPVGSPDSAQGDDPHADELGRAATPLRSDSPELRVDSYIDTPGDIDVFQFVATGDSVSLVAESWSHSFHLAVEFFNANGELLAHNLLFDDLLSDQGMAYDLNTDPANWVDPHNFLPVLEVQTQAGARYFVRLHTGSGLTGEYVLNILQHPALPDATFGVPDSRPGEDIHANQWGSTATVLEWQADSAIVHSFIDAPDDADVFRIVPDLPQLQISALAATDNLRLKLEVLDRQGNLLAISRFTESSLGIFDMFLNLSLELRPGVSYYLRLSSAAETQGRYALRIQQTTSESTTNGVREELDSRLGQDPHPEHIGADATPLTFNDQQYSIVHSFLDHAGDHDTFQWVATADVTQILAANISGLPGINLEVYDDTGQRVSIDDAPSNHFGTHVVIQALSTVPGHTYYLVISSRDNASSGMYFFEIAQRSDAAVTPTQSGTDAAMAALPGGHDGNDAIGMLGDATFDGSIDARDFAVWSENRFQNVSGPASGDFNLDGVVDGRDFGIWLQNSFRTQFAPLAAKPSRTPRAAISAASTTLWTPPVSDNRVSPVTTVAEDAVIVPQQFPHSANHTPRLANEVSIVPTPWPAVRRSVLQRRDIGRSCLHVLRPQSALETAPLQTSSNVDQSRDHLAALDAAWAAWPNSKYQNYLTDPQ